MFTFSRSRIQRFRSLLRRAKIDRPRKGIQSQLTLVGQANGYALRALSEHVAIELAVSGECAATQLTVPWDALQIGTSKSDDPVTLRRQSPDRISVEWSDGGIPQCREFEESPVDQLSPFPESPAELTENPGEFWQAAREAVECTSSESTRNATDCIQLRGSNGRLAATDGQQAVALAGFSFPWTHDIIIPAIPVLGCREFSDSGSVSIGQTAEWVTFVCGEFRISIKLERDRQFPNIDSIIPATGSSRSSSVLSDDDVRFLTSSLSRLPGDNEAYRPVTLDLNGHAAIRAQAAGQPRATELVLSQSQLEGEPARCQINREYLAKALRLGFRCIRIGAADTPLWCDDDNRQFVWMPLNSAGIIPARPDAVRIQSPAPAAVRVVPETVTGAIKPAVAHVAENTSAALVKSVDLVAPAKKGVLTIEKPPLIQEAEAFCESLRELFATTSGFVLALKRQFQSDWALDAVP